MIFRKIRMLSSETKISLCEIIIKNLQMENHTNLKKILTAVIAINAKESGRIQLL